MDMAIEIVPSPTPLGAEIRGVDIAAGLSDAEFARIRDAVHDRSVVVIRDQKLSPEQQIGFSRHFGPLEPHVLPKYLVPGYNDLLCISNILDDAGQPIGLTDAGRVWHTDGHFDERPNMYSMLYALEIPRDVEGEPLGSTWFVSTAVAYDRLSADMKAHLEGRLAENSLVAVHEALKRLNPNLNRAPLGESAKRSVVHPVIRTHPETGRKCVYVSAAATLRILDLDEDDGRRLIDSLQAHCIAENMIYRHRWQVGDVLIWDNCSSQHFANADYALPQRRLMHRTTIAGSIPF
jgi:alpha-ketoglutarate-dependent taurine dioxygenase